MNVTFTQAKRLQGEPCVFQRLQSSTTGLEDQLVLHQKADHPMQQKINPHGEMREILGHNVKYIRKNLEAELLCGNTQCLKTILLQVSSLSTFVGFKSIFFVLLNTVVLVAPLVVLIAPLNVMLLSQVVRILQILRMQLSLKTEQLRHHSEGTACLYYPLTF